MTRRIVAGAVAVAAIAFVLALFQPFKGDGGEPVRVSIPKQAGVGEIADILADRDVVSNATLFELRATLGGDRGDLKPGIYELRRDMSYGDAIDRLVKGPSRQIIQLTIPEGLSRREVAPLAGRAGVTGDYVRASGDTSLVGSRRYGLPKDAASLEGFLFPATYELRSGASAPALVRRQVAAFDDNLAQVDQSYARRKNLTTFDVVTIASMVEREAQQPRERKLVAAVIYNRLKQGIPLGIDATTRYATGNWQRPLTQSQLALDSPYNTRTQRGPAARPDRQPRAGLAAGRGAAGARRLPLLRGEAGHLRRARLLVDLGRVRARPAALQRGPRRRGRKLSHQVLMVIPGLNRLQCSIFPLMGGKCINRADPRLRHGSRDAGCGTRPPGRAQPLPGDAQRRLPGVGSR